MPDPLSLVAFGAAIGGGAGKFVEKAWDSGEKWVVSYFADHQPKAREKAEENSADFLKRLGDRVSHLEKTNQVTEEALVTAQEHPEFSVVLQKAMLSAAQTESESKHDLLSRLVAERIQASPESLLSMASKMACDAISFTTPNQLNILGLLVNMLYIQPNGLTNEQQHLPWLRARLSPFLSLDANNMDYTHLESLSCLKFESFITRDLAQILTNNMGESFDYAAFKAIDFGKNIIDIWEDKGLKSCQLTTVGQILGVMVSDQRVGGKTNMSGWGG
ncbi:MAG: hypothetical protein PF501_01755 [Salinisphaera sp.]|nr:hypothetical protein [Salinisphaera sp.]